MRRILALLRAPQEGLSASNMRPSLTVTKRPLAPISLNKAASVPVIQHWVRRLSSAENSAARRLGSRCAATSSSSRNGVMPAHLPHQPRMGQHQPDQQRLLLPGRAQGGRHGLLPVHDVEIDAVRAESGAARRPVQRPLTCPACHQLGLQRRGGIGLALIVEQRRQRQIGGGKGIGHRCLRRSAPADAQGCRRGRNAWRRLPRPSAPPPRRASAGSASSSSSRLRWRMAFSKSATATPWPGISVVTSRSRKRRRSPGGTAKQPVHGRRQPEHAQIVAHVLDGAGIGAVDAHAPRRHRPASSPVPISAGPSGVSTVAATAQGASEPRLRQRLETGPPQPAPRREAAKRLRADWSCPRRSARSAPHGARRDRARRTA